MFLEQWKALSGRIHGLVQTGQQLHASFGFDSYEALYKQLREHCLKTLTDVEHFRDSFSQSLPPSAIAAIRICVHPRAVNSVRRLLTTANTPDMTPILWNQQIWAALLSLATFETEMTFILSDVQAAIRARVERAFEHLQRLIVVDAATREQWKAALAEGEQSCERLGAVHLLLHGIFAFKVNAAGERTDLVFPRPVSGLDEQRYADGLVLTEWKVARSDAEALRKLANARAQAKLYGQGVLSGVELTTVRYAVVVSPQRIAVPDDVPDGTVVYRHINIAVDPETPSKAAAKAGAARSGRSARRGRAAHDL
jgi:hypothetical protein